MNLFAYPAVLLILNGAGSALEDHNSVSPQAIPPSITVTAVSDSHASERQASSSVHCKLPCIFSLAPHYTRSLRLEHPANSIWP